MTNLMRWRRRGGVTSTLRRDIDDIIEAFEPPRGFRREMDRLLGAELSPRMLWREMDHLLEDFGSPDPLRYRLERRFGSESMSPRPLRQRLTRLLDKAREVTGLSRRSAEIFAPDVELLTERDDAYVVRVDLPGLREQDVDVRVEGDRLIISGERHQEEMRRVRGHEYMERSSGSFTRSMALPRGADASRIDAQLRNGVLEVHVPKMAAAQTRQVPISRREGRELGRRHVEVAGGPSGATPREEPRVIAPGNGGSMRHAVS